MNMTNGEYGALVKRLSPKSPVFRDVCLAFLTGGAICCLGQAITDGLLRLGLDGQSAGAWTSIAMVFIGAFLTGIGVYDDLARFAGGGTLVPITGFANSVVSPALEFKAEGLITGMAAKMFAIAGPVIVFGISASAVYGLILALIGAG